MKANAHKQHRMIFWKTVPDLVFAKQSGVCLAASFTILSWGCLTTEPAHSPIQNQKVFVFLFLFPLKNKSNKYQALALIKALLQKPTRLQYVAVEVVCCCFHSYICKLRSAHSGSAFDYLKRRRGVSVLKHVLQVTWQVVNTFTPLKPLPNFVKNKTKMSVILQRFYVVNHNK